MGGDERLVVCGLLVQINDHFRKSISDDNYRVMMGMSDL